MLNTYVSKILSSVEHIYFMESTRNILFIRINEREGYYSGKFTTDGNYVD